MTTLPLTHTILPLIQGFLLCASIIVAIGPQNLFIIRHGLRRQHLFAIALFSTLADMILISLGVGGLSAIISTSRVIQLVATVGGVLFLLGCGARSLFNAYRPATCATTEPVATPHSANSGIIATILATLSFSFLNPSAYVDTLMVIGSKSLFFAGDQRLIFGIGAVLASTFWFFTLAYGASKLAPIFKSKFALRTIDGISGCIMIVTGLTMLAGAHFAL